MIVYYTSVRCGVVGFLQFSSRTLFEHRLISIFLFWTDSQENVKFLKLSSDPWAGLTLISHIEVSNSMAIGA
jgi:hypothetical protein